MKIPGKIAEELHGAAPKGIPGGTPKGIPGENLKKKSENKNQKEFLKESMAQTQKNRLFPESLKEYLRKLKLDLFVVESLEEFRELSLEKTHNEPRRNSGGSSRKYLCNNPERNSENSEQ